MILWNAVASPTIYVQPRTFRKRAVEIMKTFLSQCALVFIFWYVQEFFTRCEKGSDVAVYKANLLPKQEKRQGNNVRRVVYKQTNKRLSL